jgi:hypothetical protein
MRKVLLASLTLLSVFLQTRCGTIINNGGTANDPTYAGLPEGDPLISLDFHTPISQYEESPFESCGEFTEESTVAELDAGRQCIHAAFESCSDAKYLYNKTNEDGSRFVSFVSIRGDTCEIFVHTVSDVPPEYLGDQEALCDRLEPTELPETACGIGS